MGLSTSEKTEPKRIIAIEHNLRLEADPHRAKTIAQAVRDYMDKNGIDDTTLSDFIYIIETDYQAFYGLEQDNWDFVTDCNSTK